MFQPICWHIRQDTALKKLKVVTTLTIVALPCPKIMNDWIESPSFRFSNFSICLSSHSSPLTCFSFFTGARKLKFRKGKQLGLFLGKTLAIILIQSILISTNGLADGGHLSLGRSRLNCRSYVLGAQSRNSPWTSASCWCSFWTDGAAAALILHILATLTAGRNLQNQAMKSLKQKSLLQCLGIKLASS